MRKLTSLFLVCFFLFGTQSVSAGFFDDLKDKAKGMVDQVEDKVLDQKTTPVDDSFSQGSENSTTISDSIAESGESDSSSKKDPRYIGDNGAPTQTARLLLIVHYDAGILDDENKLKYFYQRVNLNDNTGWVNSNEFRWRKEKDAIKQGLIDEAEKVPTEYEITPWPQSEAVAYLQDYDFDREAFNMKMTNSHGTWPWSSATGYEWLPVSPDTAEAMVNDFENDFGGGARAIYAKYTLKILGAKRSNSRSSTYGADFDEMVDSVDIYTMNTSKTFDQSKYTYRVTLTASEYGAN